MPITLGVRAGCTILRVKEVLLSGFLLLEGKDGRECCEHSRNCAHVIYTLKLLPPIVLNDHVWFSSSCACPNGK